MTHAAIGLSIEPHNDIHFDEVGNIAMVSDAEAVGQHIRQRLKFWKDEARWFIGERDGIEWTRYVLGRPPQEQPIAESIIKKETLATDKVTAILEFDAYYDRQSRGLIVTKMVVNTIFDDEPDVVLPAPEIPPDTLPPVPVGTGLNFTTAINSQYVAALGV